MKKKIKTTIILSIVIIIFLTMFFGFYAYFPKLAFLPSRKFFKVFPEYDIPIEEIDYIEAGELVGVEHRYVSHILSAPEKYMEQLEESRVRANWIISIELFFFNETYNIGTGGIYKVVFHKKDGSCKVLYLEFLYPLHQRINGGKYFNGHIPYGKYDDLYP